MGLLENLPENSRPDDSESADQILKRVKHDLQNLQSDLVNQLTDDVKRLKAEKYRLLDEISSLRQEHQALQDQRQVVLSQQQLAQQQVWAKQLAQILASHLRTLLVQQIQQTGAISNSPDIERTVATPSARSRGNADQLLNSLDTSLNRTLSGLRQELDSYQSSLSQQIGRMHTLEQQGEAILDALVSRLNQQLQVETAKPQPRHAIANGNGYHPNHNFSSDSSASRSSSPRSSAPTEERQRPSNYSQNKNKVIPVSPATAPEPVIAPKRQPAAKRRLDLSQFQLGLLLILLSTVALSLHNVIVGIIGNESSIFGIFQLGGYLNLGLGNALLILLLRMLVVVPLMFAIAQRLYPPVWKDIKTFLTSRDRRLLITVVASGGFLFLSQVLIYIAIAEVGPGVAVTILFMYPLVTVPLAWFFFGDRPTTLRWLIMAIISIGIIFTAIPNNIFIPDNPTVSSAGVLFAVFSGIAFACYLIFMQICFKKLHPVPVSLVQFATIGVFSAVSLILLPSFPLPDRWNAQVAVDQPTGFLGLGILLGVLTLIGYLANNFGVRFMGAARAAIVASSGPALTAILAFLITPGPRTGLHAGQMLGILMVTAGVIGLSFERMLIQRRAARRSAKSS
ncbi:MAG: EamA family transporter [Elainellaceae cyanobacterium]